jgi:hypothetical protein
MGSGLVKEMISEQEKMQTKMQAKMSMNQIQTQEKIQRIMIAQQLAVSRERFFFPPFLFRSNQEFFLYFHPSSSFVISFFFLDH